MSFRTLLLLVSYAGDYFGFDIKKCSPLPLNAVLLIGLGEYLLILALTELNCRCFQFRHYIVYCKMVPAYFIKSFNTTELVLTILGTHQYISTIEL